jgi:hypothetical protein
VNTPLEIEPSGVLIEPEDMQPPMWRERGDPFICATWPKRYSCPKHGMHADWLQFRWSARAGWSNRYCLRCFADVLENLPGRVIVDGGTGGGGGGVVSPPFPPPGTGGGTIASAAVQGTTTNNNAQPGFLGEYVANQSVWMSVPNESEALMTQVTLSAGDWDVMGMGQWRPGSLAVLYNFLIVGLVTTPANPTSSNWVEGAYNAVALEAQAQGTFAGLGPLPSALNTPMVRFSLSTPTTIYCQTMTIYSNGSMTGQGSIRARRVR